MQIKDLISNISQLHRFFDQQLQKQVNTSLTLRNWLIGFYLIEYEQAGADRAKYGTKLLSAVSKELKEKKIKGLSQTNLKLFRAFYQSYPQISQTVSDQLSLPAPIIKKLEQSTSPK